MWQERIYCKVGKVGNLSPGAVEVSRTDASQPVYGTSECDWSRDRSELIVMWAVKKDVDVVNPVKSDVTYHMLIYLGTVTTISDSINENNFQSTYLHIQES